MADRPEFTADQIQASIARCLRTHQFEFIPGLVKLLALQDPERAQQVLDALQGKITLDLLAVREVPRPDAHVEAAVTGDPPQPTREDDLVRAGRSLRRMVSEHDHRHRQEIADISDWLSGDLGAPGSGWPVRLPLPAADAPTEEEITAGARALFGLTRTGQALRNPDRLWNQMCADGERPYHEESEAVLRAAAVLRRA